VRNVKRRIGLYRELLVLNTPWTVSRVELEVMEQRVEVWVGHAEGVGCGQLLFDDRAAPGVPRVPQVWRQGPAPPGLRWSTALLIDHGEHVSRQSHAPSQRASGQERQMQVRRLRSPGDLRLIVRG
jgi:hypothetical protein